jgi:hypothetical protein
MSDEEELKAFMKANEALVQDNAIEALLPASTMLKKILGGVGLGILSLCLIILLIKYARRAYVAIKGKKALRYFFLGVAIIFVAGFCV